MTCMTATVANLVKEPHTRAQLIYKVVSYASRSRQQGSLQACRCHHARAKGNGSHAIAQALRRPSTPAGMLRAHCHAPVVGQPGFRVLTSGWCYSTTKVHMPRSA